MSFKGIDILSGTTIVFGESLKTSAGAILATGDTFLFLSEVQADGTLKTFDFNDFTFKATACTDDEIAMTHRQTNNNTVDTGIWTYLLNNVAGFTVGNIYIQKVVNAGAMPVEIERKFQWAGNQEDISTIKAKTDLISTNIISANPAYMHDPLVDQANIVVAQVGLIRNKPSATPIQIVEITTPGLIKVWRYRKGTDAGWTLIVAGGGMAAAIGGIYFQYTFPSASWRTGDLILYEIYNTVVTLGTEVFTLSTVQGFGMVGTADSLALILEDTGTTLPNSILKLKNLLWMLFAK